MPARFVLAANLVPIQVAATHLLFGVNYSHSAHPHECGQKPTYGHRTTICHCGNCKYGFRTLEVRFSAIPVFLVLFPVDNTLWLLYEQQKNRPQGGAGGGFYGFSADSVS